jgi:HSP20 family protein
MLPSKRRTSDSTGLRNLSDLRYEMDRLFEDAVGGRGRSVSGWTPATNFVETDGAYEASLELPGFDRDDIEVTVDQGVLTIAGERAAEHQDEERTYHLRERSVGRFRRSFSLPSSVSAENVSATFRDGVLRIELPKQEQARTRKIEVDVG